MSLVVQSAKSATNEAPFLSFSNIMDYWVIRNALLNEISASVFPEGFINPDAVRKWFVFGITCEKDSRLMQKKLRVLLIQEDHLREIIEKSLKAEVGQDPFLQVRWDTLQVLAKEFKEHGCDLTKSNCLGRVELVLPKA